MALQKYYMCVCLFFVFIWKVTPICDAFDLTYQFHVTSAEEFPNNQDNQLYLNGSHLIVHCQLYDPVDDSPEVRVHLYRKYRALGHSPSLTFRNSSWHRTFSYKDYAVQQNTSSDQMWTFSIPKSSFTEDSDDIFSLEQWRVSVELDESLSLFMSRGSLLDLAREPVLQWTLGDALVTPPPALSSAVDRMIVVTSPCSPDVSLVIPVQNTSHEIYIGVTYSSFSAVSTDWYNMTHSFCETMNYDPLCRDLSTFGAVLTNQHLLVLSSAGVFVSSDLTLSSSDSQHILPFSHLNLFENATVSDPFQKNSDDTFTIHNTPGCISLQKTAFRNDLVAVCHWANEKNQSTCVYSSRPFSKWHPIRATQGSIACVPNHHSDTLVMLTINQVNEKAVQIYSFEAGSDSVSLSQEQLVPAFTFPASADIRNLCFHPVSNLLYAYGKQVWLSLDGGNYFTEIHRLPDNDSVINVIFGDENSMVVMATTKGYLLYGKAGINRLAYVYPFDGAPFHRFYPHISHRSQVYMLSIESGQMQRRSVDVTSLIQDADYSRTHPLALQFLTETDLLIHEHRPIDAASANVSTAFVHANVGQVLTLRKGGSAVIHEVRAGHPVPGFLSILKLYILKPFHFETDSDSPAVKWNINIQNSGSSAADPVVLVLSGRPSNTAGWLGSDVGKTVTSPGKPSYLITKVLDNTHAWASPTMDIKSSFTVYQGHWHMYHFGVNQTQNTALWRLGESECHHRMTTDDMWQGRQVMDVDLGHSVTFSVLAALYGVEPKSDDGSQLVQASLSQAQDFVLSSDLSHSPLGYTNLTLIMYNHVYHRGQTAVCFFLPMASLLCEKTSHIVTVYSGCPFMKRMRHWYPRDMTDDEILHGNPTDDHDRNLLYQLEANYRPPSHFGIDIPVNDHLYNVHPERPIPRNEFRISKASGSLKQCAEKSRRSECGCTDAMKLSSLAKFSDCKERVYRLLHPGRLRLNLSIQELYSPEYILNETYVIHLTEINNRSDYNLMTEDSLTINLLKETGRFTQSVDYHSPHDLNIVMIGSGLYHFKASVITGMSYCDLNAEIQVFVDVSTMAYPLQYILNFSVSILIGGILFIVYLWYLSNHHVTRFKRSGPDCLDLHNEVLRHKHMPKTISTHIEAGGSGTYSRVRR